MQSDPDAKTARENMPAVEMLGIHLYVLTAAVRAILATHQKPEQVRGTFDVLIAQMQAHPAYMANHQYSLVLRDFVETLFQPPVVLDKDLQ